MAEADKRITLGGRTSDWRAPILLALVAQGLFLWRLATPSTPMFDEVHYVPAARALLALSGPTNVEHPLFGKTLIAFIDSPTCANG